MFISARNLFLLLALLVVSFVAMAEDGEAGATPIFATPARRTS